MRQVKFRAWDKLQKCFLKPGNCVCDPIGGISGWKANTDDGIEMQQFTGFKDKNGKEIYEGDFLKSGEGILEVYWWLWGWAVRTGDGYHGFLFAPWGEVVGNIYENPELLKSRDN